jgi:serine/threonine protein phosphatase PrpC
LRIEYADISLLGKREENQDRSAVLVGDSAALLLVVDGMGGHAHGARAAEITVAVLSEAFAAVPQPLFDPLGFLHLTLGRVHEQVVQFGMAFPLEHRPRATCAVCLVQEGAAWFAHIGDSRIYLLRRGAVSARTRDHSHVEFLVREGSITADQAQGHPMRNFVECCVGGDPVLPEMSIAARRVLEPNDVLLCCTDGFWSGLADPDIARAVLAPGSLRDSVRRLAEQAVAAHGAASDNTTASAVRWLGP